MGEHECENVTYNWKSKENKKENQSLSFMHLFGVEFSPNWLCLWRAAKNM